MVREEIEHLVVRTPDGVELPGVRTGPSGTPTLVLVHGVASSWRAWEALMAQRRLTERFELVAFDLRGHGEHAAPLGADQLRGAERADPWIRDLDAVLDAVDTSAGVHLVGWSFGSTAVLAWMRHRGGLGAAASATLVSGLSVLGPALGEPDTQDPVSAEALPALAGAATGGEQAYAHAVLARRGETNDAAAIGDAVRLAVEQDARRARPEAVAAALSHTYDHRAFLRALPDEERARVTALVCQDDRLFDASAAQTGWAQAGVRSHLLRDQPHGAPLIHPDRLADELFQVLTSSSSDAQEQHLTRPVA